MATPSVEHRSDLTPDLAGGCEGGRCSRCWGDLGVTAAMVALDGGENGPTVVSTDGENATVLEGDHTARGTALGHAGNDLPSKWRKSKYKKSLDSLNDDLEGCAVYLHIKMLVGN